MGECGFNCWGAQGARARVLVLHECIWNAPVVSLVHPAFDDTGSLGSPPGQVVHHPGPMVPPWVTWKGELKPISFFSPLLFRVFLYFLFS